MEISQRDFQFYHGQQCVLRRFRVCFWIRPCGCLESIPVPLLTARSRHEIQWNIAREFRLRKAPSLLGPDAVCWGSAHRAIGMHARIRSCAACHRPDLSHARPGKYVSGVAAYRPRARTPGAGRVRSSSSSAPRFGARSCCMGQQCSNCYTLHVAGALQGRGALCWSDTFHGIWSAPNPITMSRYGAGRTCSALQDFSALPYVERSGAPRVVAQVERP